MYYNVDKTGIRFPIASTVGQTLILFFAPPGPRASLKHDDWEANVQLNMVLRNTIGS